MTERRRTVLVVLAIWLSFLLVSLSCSQIPGVNESHYLTKSKHYWNPDWCSRDFFLTSFPAHRVFYQTLGCLTQWFELATVALIGRVIGTGMLAVSWTMLVKSLSDGRTSRLSEPTSKIAESIAASQATSDWLALSSAWLFLGMQAIGNLSGEWLIGGFESKVIAFAFLFWSVASRLSQRFLSAAICCGLAIAFHPIIGLWHLVALMFVEVADRQLHFVGQHSSGPHRRRWAEIALLFVTALPGLWPAIELLRIGDSKASYAANFVQVFYRLKHHLDPMDFGIWNYASYGLLAAIWLALLRLYARRSTISSRDRIWICYIIAAAVFALCGYLVGFGPRPAQEMWGFRWRMGLLKFYPFRLFDLILPIAVAVSLALCASGRWCRVVWVVAFAGFGFAAVKHQFQEPSIPWTHEARADWKAACAWINQNTPADSLFLTPIESDSFKWFAQRAEWVNFKDCPQDAAGIVEWNGRLKWIDRWSKAAFEDERYSNKELKDLRQKTNAEFAMVRTRVPYEADLIYSNKTFNVFRLPNVSE